MWGGFSVKFVLSTERISSSMSWTAFGRAPRAGGSSGAEEATAVEEEAAGSPIFLVAVGEAFSLFVSCEESGMVVTDEGGGPAKSGGVGRALGGGTFGIGNTVCAI